MVLNYEWNGILKHKYDVYLSLKEYGFAIRFCSKTKSEHFYECLVPNDDDSYYLCTLSVEEDSLLRIMHFSSSSFAVICRL